MIGKIHCPSCSVELPKGTTSCAFCGATIQPESAQMATDASPAAHRVTFEGRAAHQGRAVQAMDRYRDGYLHARAIDGFGAAVKVIALLVGGLLVVVGMYACGGSSNSFGGIGEIGGIAIMLIGLLAGGMGYILGVLVQSAGQSMKAHFDSAVNTSHFLNDDQRAEVMSLK